MLADKRRIQTAVLGSADSDEPLMLPMEAIELDAFRHHHDGDTFWCGILLGGCGGQLTTKLYTDRACHFAHHPDPDGLPHVCGRRARGVNSADHLYVKAAAAAWLSKRGENPRFDYARPGDAHIGSVVDVRWQHGALRVHLDQEVEPEWDNEWEPVLATSVPVDSDTLFRRWYVHRIRLDSEGTERRVRIGTEGFARPTQWFGLDECEMTERGLSTPAVEEIVESHKTPPPARWTPGQKAKLPEPEARAQSLQRRLVYGRRIGSASLVKEVLREIEGHTGLHGESKRKLDAAVHAAEAWLVEQDTARRHLFAKLDRAVKANQPGKVRKLLIRVNATAADDRTHTERLIFARATDYFASLDALDKDVVDAEADAERKVRHSAAKVRTILKALRQYDAYTKKLRPQVEQLRHFAPQAGELLTPKQAHWVEIWTQRAAEGPEDLLAGQVGRRQWLQRSCPRCHADQGKKCVLVEGAHVGKDRATPHDDRLRPIVEERQARQQRKQAEKQAPKPRSTQPQRKTKTKTPERHLHHQVPRRDWYSGTCRRCHAGPGKVCLNDDRVGPGATRQIPHDERLQPLLPPRPAAAPAPEPVRPKRSRQQETDASAARTWHAHEVTCPKCGADANTPCTDGEEHPERAAWAKEFTRKLWG